MGRGGEEGEREGEKDGVMIGKRKKRIHQGRAREPENRNEAIVSALEGLCLCFWFSVFPCSGFWHGSRDMATNTGVRLP